MSSEPRVTSSPTPQPDVEMLAKVYKEFPASRVRSDVLELVSALRAERTENERLHEVMEWVAGHDQSGLDHLNEMLVASEERDQAEAALRVEAATSQQLRAALAELLDWPFEFVPEQGFGEVLMNARAVLAVESPQAKDTHES